MPPRFISSILLYSILFLLVSADVNLDSSQQQPPAATADYSGVPPPPTNFLATNNPNWDFSTDTTTTFGINDNDVQSSSQQQQLPEPQADAYDGSTFASPSSSSTTGGPLLLSSGECDKIQNGGGNHANGASGGQRRRRRTNKKRQLRNCPNSYLQNPNPPTNSVRIKESSDDDDTSDGGQTLRAGDGLLIQTKPKPNLNLCPNLERPFPVCARDDASFPMGDSWLISKGRPCK